MISGLILAAGLGERFSAAVGGDGAGLKQLARLSDGRSVLYASVRNMRAAVESVIVVVRDDPELVEHANEIVAELGGKIVVNARAAEGMATSIGCGVDAAPDADGWLIGLGDMPCIRPHSIEKIAAALASTQGIVVPFHLQKQQRGHPVGFGRKFADELRLLVGDGGARELISRHNKSVSVVELDDDGIVFDVDLPSDMLSKLDIS